MVAVERTVLLLLAAGRSARFGGGPSKLDEVFLGRPLGLHIAGTLERMPFQALVAVTGRATIDYAAQGFQVVHNAEAASGLASSLKLGVAHAKALGAEAVLLALADMPRVTEGHIQRLFDAASGPDSIVASSDGRDPKPPALFGAARFDSLLALAGDVGARDLVRAGRHVVTSPAELLDVDTPADLEHLRALVRPGARGGAARPIPARG